MHMKFKFLIPHRKWIQLIIHLTDDVLNILDCRYLVYFAAVVEAVNIERKDEASF